MQEEFPNCPICGATNGYETSGILSKYAKCQTCEVKWQLFVKNNKITHLTLHELPKDGSSVYTIISLEKPLFTVIAKRLPTYFWKNLKLNKKVNWEFLSKGVTSNVSKAVIVEKGEKLLHQWVGMRVLHGKKVVQGNTIKTTKNEYGNLLLSTKKLRWLAIRESGFWKKAVSLLVVYEIPLEDIRGISGETGDSNSWRMFKKASIVDSKGENIFSLQYAFLEVFKPIIENAIEIRRTEIAKEKKKERFHVILDFSSLKTYMEKGGLIMKVLKCPECGAKIEFPKSGTQTKCSHCGNTIYAQDIFEKIKSLLE